MSFLYKLREELQEKGDDEQTYMHAINIGIGCHDDLVVSQCVETIFNVKSSLEEIKLLVFIYDLLGESE